MTCFPPGKVVASATKGGRFSIARKGGCLVLYKLAPLHFQKAPHHGLCPLSEAMQPFYTTHGTEGRQARWMPYAPLRRRRRPLREYSRPADWYLSRNDSLSACTKILRFAQDDVGGRGSPIPIPAAPSGALDRAAPPTGIYQEMIHYRLDMVYICVTGGDDRGRGARAFGA